MFDQNQPKSEFSPSDGSLLRRIQGGEEDAATELYLRYSNRLINLARNNTAPELAVRFDPEDVVQSVFRSFFRRASTGGYDVAEGGELWRLLLVLALNKVRALAIHHRSQKRNVSKTVGGDGVRFPVASFHRRHALHHRLARHHEGWQSQRRAGAERGFLSHLPRRLAK